MVLGLTYSQPPQHLPAKDRLSQHSSMGMGGILKVPRLDEELLAVSVC